MKKNLLCFYFLLVTTLSFAQFSGQSGPIIYIYEYTDTDGIKTQEYEQISSYNGSAYIVIFKNEYAGICSDSVKRIAEGKTDLNNPAKNLSKFLQFLTINKPNSFYDHEYGYIYCSDISSYSKYTYRKGTREIVNRPIPQVFGYPLPNPVFTDGWDWSNECFTFSIDKSRMIRWDYQNPIKRMYFKQVSSDDIKQSVKKDLDFLYD